MQDTTLVLIWTSWAPPLPSSPGYPDLFVWQLCQIGSFKWQGINISDSWQKYATGDGGSSCTILICCLSIIGLFCPFPSTVTFPTPPTAFLLHPCTLALLLQGLHLQLVTSFWALMIFFTACKVMSSLGLSPAWERRFGNGRYWGRYRWRMRLLWMGGC